MVKTSPSNAGSADSIPGLGAKIPCSQNAKHKTEQYYKKFNKVFKNAPHKKKKKRLKKCFFPPRLQMKKGKCYTLERENIFK